MNLLRRLMENFVEPKVNDQEALANASKVDFDLVDQEKQDKEMMERIYDADIADSVLSKMLKRPHDEVLHPSKQALGPMFELGPELESEKGKR